MAGLQPYLFVKFTVHGLFRLFTRLYPTLGELPGILTNPARPQDTANVIHEDYPDVRPEAFLVYHNPPTLKTPTCYKLFHIC